MAALPSVEGYAVLLRDAGIDFAPGNLGITAGWIEEGLLSAMHIRERYTILRFASSQGWLEELTERIMLDYN